MTGSRVYFALLDAMSKDGCAVCRLVLDEIDHAFESINYEFVNDPGFRAKVDSSWGFCNLHAHQWLARAHPLGTAILYESVLDEIESALRSADLRRGSNPLAQLASRLGAIEDQSETTSNLKAKTRCPICRIRTEHEQLCVDRLLEGLTEPDFLKAYLASDGVCVPHVGIAMQMCTEKEMFEMLRDHAIKTESLIRAQLQEINRKHDYRFHDQPIGDERDAPEHVIDHVTGKPGIQDRSSTRR